jgi:hypothetical protein
MVKIGGVISPPRDALSAPSTLVRAEKLEVATPHQVQPGSDQPDCSVTEVVRLPGNAGWHAALPEQPLRNRAVGFAGEVCVGRAEKQHKSPASREAIRQADRLGYNLPQAKRCVSADGKVLIERDTAATGVAAVAPPMSRTGVRP